jgi:thiol-disulfide isomerase/thioredoxin
VLGFFTTHDSPLNTFSFPDHMPNRLSLANLLLVFGLFFGALLAPEAAHAQDLNPPPGFQLHPAPRPVGDLAFLDAEGRTVRLADFKGRVVLINLWATWCPPCRTEMPSLNELQKLLGPEGLMVAPVSLDQKGKALVAPFYRENNLQALPMFFDPAMSLNPALRLRGVPASVLIGRDGWEIGRLEGPYPWMDKRMVLFLRRLLAPSYN